MMLVVDDDPRNRKLLESYLRSEGYGMLSCADGPTALTLSREHLPDVILLDVMMPEMTGHEVCRMLKGDPKTRNCQVMMVTALSGTANTVEGLDTGADDYVSKPALPGSYAISRGPATRWRRATTSCSSRRPWLRRWCTT